MEFHGLGRNWDPGSPLGGMRVAVLTLVLLPGVLTVRLNFTLKQMHSLSIFRYSNICRMTSDNIYFFFVDLLVFPFRDALFSKMDEFQKKIQTAFERGGGGP